MEQYTIKLVTEKPVEIDFQKLHDLVFKDITEKYSIEERSLWNISEWINNIGDELCAFAEHYLETLLEIEIDTDANDMIIDEISSDFYHFLDALYQ
jgi:hypothetical protein